MNKIYIILLSLIIVLNTGCLKSASPKTRDIAINLDTPWEILWGPDNYIWMTERYGRISRVNPETGEVIPIITVSDVFEDGERGLMGLALHPDFQANPYLYTVYTYRTNGDQTFIKIIRFTYNGSILNNPLVLMDSVKGYWNHDGSRLWIDEELKLYATIGDAASAQLAQELNSRNGKILRMNLDGSIPEDNPFPGSYVWSWGHRNPQGLVFANGKIYSSEHGPDKDDEVNIIEKGRNYGWPAVNGFCDLQGEKNFCEENNVAEPVYAWTPTLAVCGLDYYNHKKFGEWENSLLMVSLKAGKLTAMKLNEPGDSVIQVRNYFDGSIGRLRDLCISPDGRVFISTSNKDGRGSPGAVDDRIIEILPESSSSDEKGNYEKKIDVSPMPAKESIEFKFRAMPEPASLRVYNLQGEEVYTGALSPGTVSFYWDLADRTGTKLKAGIYNSIVYAKDSAYGSLFVVSP